MKKFVKVYWKTILFFTLIGLVGGFFLGLYTLDSYPEEMRQQILDQGINEIVFAVITAMQSAGYGFVLGTLGILLSKQIGLWKDEKTIARTPLIITIIIALVGGLLMILPDILFFGQYSEVIMDSYVAKPTISYFMASVTYGAVIEEVMLRLFMMSLIAFILYKLFGKKNGSVTATTLIISNVIAALLFAVAHLPATFIMIGSTPLIIFRCLLLNGGLGLLFGYLYRKYGLRYAMLAHGGCHIVSKLIWIIFI